MKATTSQFPTLSKELFYKTNSTEIAEIEDILGKPHHFSFGPNGRVEVANLFKYHFDPKLYDGVTEGSYRWWFLEKRKYDYEFITANKLSTGCKKTISRKQIDEVISGWENKVISWYNAYYTSTGGDSCKTKYSIRKNFSDDKILDEVDAYNMGYLGDGDNVTFSKITVDGEGHISVTVTPIKMNNTGCKKFSERWWAIERIKYDNGDKNHPVTGDDIYDWYGLAAKAQLCDDVDELISWHEYGWVRWVHDVYEPAEHVSSNEKTHNFEVISKLDNSALLQLAKELPTEILNHIPSDLYSGVLIHLLSSIENRVKISDRETLAEVKKLSLTVNNKYVTGCHNITIEHVLTAVKHISPTVIPYLITSILTSIDKFKLSRSSKKLLENFLSITIYPPKDLPVDASDFDNFCESKGIDELGFWGGDYFNEFIDEFMSREKRSKDKFGLI